MIQLDFVRMPLLRSLLFLSLALYYFYNVRRRKTAESSSRPATPTKKTAAEYSENAYYNIETLHNFDVDKEEPLKLRPFKRIFHLTMGIENTTLSDLIAMDNTYRSRLQIRSDLVKNEHHEVIACNPRGEAAVYEMYEWLTSTYLPCRFPSMFTLSGPNNLRNNVSGELLPLHPPSATNALEILGSNIDDEFLFLLPSSDPTDEGKYCLDAFVNCFPSGFNTRSKLNLLLADIHGPVPGYKQKLEKSMDRFFASMPVGRIVKRFNWGINTNGNLFCLEGNHLSEAELAEALEKEKNEVIDLDKTVLRCERQTLHRLPRSRALVFAFKTYQYAIRELRDEGSGEALAEAIDGLESGSVPGMVVYKRQVIWGSKVKTFLRGEIDA